MYLMYGTCDGDVVKKKRNNIQYHISATEGRHNHRYTGIFGPGGAQTLLPEKEMTYLERKKSDVLKGE